MIFTSLYKKLAYTFKDQTLLQCALTHCSAGSPNNERYEFLGDSILSMVIAGALLERFPQQTEGELSQLRAYLVNGEMLANIAMTLNLGQYMYLGQGELKSGGKQRASILADALEAIFAAIFLDADFSATQASILHLYKTYIDDPLLLNNIKDAKTQLQEYAQQKKYSLPHYQLDHIDGVNHNQTFYVNCTINKHTAVGAGETRRKAEQNAAKNLLITLKFNL